MRTQPDHERKVGKVTLRFTNQNKIYWPDDKITKGDLVNYYSEISSVILPYLKDRPQSLRRHPNGIDAPSFFQKDQNPDVIPEWVRTEKIFSESNNADINYLICNDKATLLFMANLGCIEINPWLSRLGKLENPDWAVLDLDPLEIDFKEVVKTALETKLVLAKEGIDCFCKTSGSRGLHICIPLGAKYEYEISKTFIEVIANRVHELLPYITSLERSPSKRKGKIYLDYLQNRIAQTLTAPYSVRPRPGAPVSTPLHWSEVNPKLDPSKFTMKTIFHRLDKYGDLWKPLLGKGVNLHKAFA